MPRTAYDRVSETTENSSADRRSGSGVMTGGKTLFIRTYGCQMNVYDSARMADVLAPLGYRPVDAPDGADMVILNTCHIREKAAEKVYSELGRLRRLKQAKRSEEHTLNSSH